MDKMQSTLGRVRGLGSAKSGTHHWINQRLSAVALVVLGLWFVYSMATLGSPEYFTYYAWLERPQNSLLMLLFSVTSLYHGKLGVQVVFEDYVHGKAAKVIALTLLNLLTVAAMAAAVFAIAIVALGA